MKTGSVKPVLYDYGRSSSCYRVRIALNLKGIDYDRQVVDLLKAEHKNAEYLQFHPQGLVPTLKIEGQMLTQSLAIIQYLDDKWASPSLIPKDPVQKAQALTLAYMIAMETQSVTNLAVARHVGELLGSGDIGKVAWIKHYLAKGLSDFERVLAKTKRSVFCVGDTPTIADICLVPQMYNARRWGIALDNLARVTRITNDCNAVPAFKKAMPEEKI